MINDGSFKLDCKGFNISGVIEVFWGEKTGCFNTLFVKSTLIHVGRFATTEEWKKTLYVLYYYILEEIAANDCCLFK